MNSKSLISACFDCASTENKKRKEYSQHKPVPREYLFPSRQLALFSPFFLAQGNSLDLHQILLRILNWNAKMRQETCKLALTTWQQWNLRCSKEMQQKPTGHPCPRLSIEIATGCGKMMLPYQQATANYNFIVFFFLTKVLQSSIPRRTKWLLSWTEYSPIVRKTGNIFIIIIFITILELGSQK